MEIGSTKGEIQQKAKPASLKLRQAQAEREGFEPSVQLPVQRFSRPSHSTTLASFLFQIKNKYILLRVNETPVLIFIWPYELYIRKPDYSLLQYNVAKTRITTKKSSRD